MLRLYRRPAPAATELARARVAGLRGPVAEPASEPSAVPVAVESAQGADEPAPAGRAGWVQRWLPDRLVPLAVHGARLDPGRRGVAAVAVVVLLAGVVAGFAVWRSRPRPVAVATRSPVAPPGQVARVGPTVVVAVAGGVRRP
ncbi:MAG: hypothetical protein M3042_09630, partial [Actinomycetota bacterium]|nr:hypothetical protein [Actinomycetota bacterium]